jgi:hypothetical protein
MMPANLNGCMNTTPFTALLLIASLAGCGVTADLILTPSEGAVLAVDPDTFSVTASDSEFAVATRVARIKAENYCASLGQKAFITRIKDDTRLESIGRRPVATIIFQCLTNEQFEQALQRQEQLPAVPHGDSRK